MRAMTQSEGLGTGLARRDRLPFDGASAKGSGGYEVIAIAWELIQDHGKPMCDLRVDVNMASFVRRGAGGNRHYQVCNQRHYIDRAAAKL